MDIRKVKKLIELLEESDIDEIEIKEGEDSVRIIRRSTRNTPTHTNVIPAATTEPQSSPKPSVHAIKSPMVGTFYTAATPGETPFVEVGQQVVKGDVVGIIEAMKMMNPIEADRDGIIESILLKGGDTVEFNQPLMTLA